MLELLAMPCFLGWFACGLPTIIRRDTRPPSSVTSMGLLTTPFLTSDFSVLKSQGSRNKSVFLWVLCV